MMPEAWPNIRSMARCVLPVFVGPRTAFTRAGKPDSRPCMGRMFVRRGAECKGLYRQSEDVPKIWPATAPPECQKLPTVAMTRLAPVAKVAFTRDHAADPAAHHHLKFELIDPGFFE